MIMKAYTDIEQSKKLAEILPIVTADMCYPYDRHLNKMYGDIPYVMGYKRFNENTDFPCWSLSALLDVLPDEITEDGDVFRNMFFHLKGKYIIQYPRLTTLWPSLLSVEADNPIDTCVEMIIKLNEQNLL